MAANKWVWHQPLKNAGKFQYLIFQQESNGDMLYLETDEHHWLKDDINLHSKVYSDTLGFMRAKWGLIEKLDEYCLQTREWCDV